MDVFQVKRLNAFLLYNHSIRILYSRLVRDLMGLQVVLLYYPGHLATAVEFNENIPGDYIVLNGHRYLVCDPTYINAEIGNTMPGMDNSKVSVIML